MKNSILFLSTLMLCGHLMAQRTIEKQLPAQEGDQVDLEFKFASSVQVGTWDDSEVQLVVTVNSENEPFVDGFAVDAERKGSVLRFTSNSEELLKTFKSENDCCYCCDHGMEITIQLKMPDNLDLHFNSISGNIDVPVITGDLDLKTISGNITVKPGGVMRLHSISGDVELLIDEPLGAEFSAKTISGEIFSNLDFEYLDGKDGLRMMAGQKVRGRLNEGGDRWDLETISGNIFLRQL